MKNKKCGKCNSKKLEIVEIWTGSTISWTPNSGYDDGVLSEGDPYRVEMHCMDCGHSWKLRGVTQVEESFFCNTQPNNANERDHRN